MEPRRAQGKGDGTAARRDPSGEVLVCQHRSGSVPGRLCCAGAGQDPSWGGSWCASTGQDPSQGGPGVPAQVRVHPREVLLCWHRSGSIPGRVLVCWGGCRPHPRPGPFPWLKVVKVRRCVRVRRNLLVLPSSTRRVNAFVGDSAFWEHRSPSRPLRSWPGDGAARRGHRGDGDAGLGGSDSPEAVGRRSGSRRAPRPRCPAAAAPRLPAAPGAAGRWKTRCVPKTKFCFCVSGSVESRVSERSCWVFIFLFLFFKKTSTFIQSVAKNPHEPWASQGRGAGTASPASQQV